VFRTGGPTRTLEGVAAGDATPHEFTIASPHVGGPGLHGCITMIDRPAAPANPLAAITVAALGGPRHETQVGTLGIRPTCTIDLRGLIIVQQLLIRSIYSTAQVRSGW
jgi:hypothetical protein